MDYYYNIRHQALNSLIRFDVLQPVALERLSAGYPFVGVKREHFVEQVQRRCGHQMNEILPNLSPVLLLRLQIRETWQVYHLGPVRWARSAAETRDHHQLLEVFIGLDNKSC